MNTVNTRMYISVAFVFIASLCAWEFKASAYKISDRSGTDKTLGNNYNRRRSNQD